MTGTGHLAAPIDVDPQTGGFIGPQYRPPKQEVFATFIELGDSPALVYPELFAASLEVAIAASKAAYVQRYGAEPERVRVAFSVEMLSPSQEED